ncbi:OmpA family protein [Cellulophaga sp. Asnod2-G02]|uniref:OmpA family protein n=1 Tax=Cellulophaga sp. Asnod2-G02 TaxID=3160572 RepID=UPI0038640CF6
MKTFPQIMFLFFTLSSLAVKSQNLVKNPSFESNYKCPEKFGSLDIDAKNWHKPTLGTTDYFNTCSKELPVTDNFIGSQLPFEGNAYAGMYLYAPNDYREYITAELETPLEKDKLYKVSFMVSLADDVEFAVKEFDVLLSPSVFEMNTSKHLDVRYFSRSAQLNFKRMQSQEYLDNTDSWVEISTHIMAKGDEQFLTIGNFSNNEDTFTQVVKKTSRKSSYYFIDMVSVEMIPSYMPNQLYVIEELLFDFDETTIEITYNKQLSDLVTYLKSNPKLNIYLYGHTDAMGSVAYNDELSEKRAATVAKFLEKSGLSKNRISWKGFGFKKPVVSNEKEDVRFKNRRVEFLVAEPQSTYAKNLYEDGQ